MRINNVMEALESQRYPSSVESMVSDLDDPRIELADGAQYLSEIYGTVSVEKFETIEEAQLVFLSGLKASAIGRKGYSDRDPPTARERHADSVTL